MIVFSVPHDGSQVLPGFPMRKSGVMKRDICVSDIVRDILAFVPGSMVKGEISRKQIDFNRPASLAFEDEGVGSYYDAYHREIEERIKESAFLFDMHGFQSRAGRDFDLVIASNDGETLLGNRIDLFIAKELERRGYRVSTKRLSFDPIFTAGHTATHYALRGVPTLQIEIAHKFRQKETRELGKKLSCDLGQICKDLLLLEAGNRLHDFKWHREDDRIGLI